MYMPGYHRGRHTLVYMHPCTMVGIHPCGICTPVLPWVHPLYTLSGMVNVPVDTLCGVREPWAQVGE